MLDVCKWKVLAKLAATQKVTKKCNSPPSLAFYVLT